LQDEVGTFDNSLAFDIIQQELSNNATELFDFTSLTPIASASIGQVYKVKLRNTNTTCALKVQRPDALCSAALDMYLLRKLAAYAKQRYKLKSDLVGVADVSQALPLYILLLTYIHYIGIWLSII
jgi:predicted unusual protein kinase regulating ubiquinone biosynthesis (AarF/ABC1/UbiB family)